MGKTRQVFKTRERQEGKTMYSHFQYGMIIASVNTLKRLLGNDYEKAKKVYHKLNQEMQN